MAGPRRAPHPGRPRGTAKDRALRLLGARSRGAQELRRRLLMAGFEEAEVERAIADLERVGLLDDERFAAEFARTRARNRLDADRSVRSSLLAKGLAREVAERAVAGLGDEDERARALARKAASRAAGADPATAPRRLMEMLLRRGYPYETAHDAVRAVLAERGAPVPDEPA